VATQPIAVAVFLAFSTWCGSLSADPAPPSGEALSMTADRLELDLESKTAVLTGHVKLGKGGLSVSCPRVDVRYDQVPHVTWVKGSGGVLAEVKGVRAEAPEAELDLPTQTLELRGGVRLTRGEGWISAERASIQIGTGKVSMSEVKGSIPVKPGEPGAAPKPSP
jgi:lipopolysaccharide export system protein LptA